MERKIVYYRLRDGEVPAMPTPTQTPISTPTSTATVVPTAMPVSIASYANYSMTGLLDVQ